MTAFRQRRLTRAKPDRPRKRFCMMDFETDGFTSRWRHGGFAMEDGPWGYHETLDDVVDFLRDNAADYTFYFHNYEFDGRYLHQHLLDRLGEGVRIIPLFQGQRCIGADISWGKGHRAKTRIRDSFALCPVSLRRFIAAFAPEHSKGDIDFDTTSYDKANPEHRDYLRRDVIGPLAALIRLDALLVEHFGCHLRASAPGTAMVAWRRTLAPGEQFWRNRPGVEAFARLGYRGGLVYVRDTDRHEDTTTLDFNAMYASAMRAGVPGGLAVYVTEWWPDRPGIYRVRLEGNDASLFGLMPAAGEVFRTSEELRLAAEAGIPWTVIEGVVWEQTVYPFATFLERCETIELAHKGQPLGEMMKLLRNSLYGKFGMKELHEKYVVSAEAPSDQHGPVMVENGGHATAEPNTWVTYEEVQAAYMNVHWAAWITAGARAKLIRTAMVLGSDHVIYMDTDSLTLSREVADEAQSREVIEVGGAYGKLKVEKQSSWYQAHAKKVYDGVLPDGTWYFRVKGLPHKGITREDFDRLREGGVIERTWIAPTKTRTMLRGETAFEVERSRTICRS